jgi:hypothetical protein
LARSVRRGIRGWSAAASVVLEGAVVALRSAYVEVIRAEEQVSILREERMAA